MSVAKLDEKWTQHTYALFLLDIADSVETDGLNTFQRVRLSLAARLFDQMTDDEYRIARERDRALNDNDGDRT